MSAVDVESPVDIESIRRTLREGFSSIALDMVRRATESTDAPAVLFHLGALASIRMGATGEAEAWLARFADHPALRLEAAAVAGRIAKDRFANARARASGRASAHARLAVEHYRRAFELEGSPYAAVNAATMAMLTGDEPLARALAQSALDACAVTGADDHWLHASRGEALLLLGRLAEAGEAYARARALAGTAFGDIGTMRRQLTLIGSPAARALLDRVPAPTIIAFVGHMIDAAGRPTPRFPPSLEDAVAKAIREHIARDGPAIGFSGAACGADILFLEAMQDAGMQTHVVLPCATADFLEASVRFAGERWVERFERALSRASVVRATDEPLLGDSVLFEHASNLLHGMARLRAADLVTEPLLLAVRDPEAPAREGGTAATMDAWLSLGRRVETIDLGALRARAGVPGGSAPLRPPEPSARSLKSLLFADIKGFSTMPEQYTPRFVEVFLGTCKRLLDGLERRAVDANTRGDGIYIVFERTRDAAEFAIRLQREIAAVDWTTLGLPPDTKARIGLHTGPVFETFDPVMDKPTFYGTHVNRTARLEPVVQPGHVFVTEAFAATLVARAEHPFRCHYIGQMSLAKKFGDEKLYRLVGEDDD